MMLKGSKLGPIVSMEICEYLERMAGTRNLKTNY